MYGRSTVARSLPGRATIRVAGFGAADGGGRMSGYSPRPASVGVGQGQGAGSCDVQPPPGAMQAWCYDQSAKLLLSSGNVTVPAAVGPVAGVATFTLLPVEAVTLVDIDILDFSNLLIWPSILAGRIQYIEGGSPNSNALQSAKTLCKIMGGIRLYPTTGLVLTANNTTAAPIVANVTAVVMPIPCR